MNIFLSFEGQTRLICEEQIHELIKLTNESSEGIFLKAGGKVCGLESKFENNQNVQVCLKLKGGKGGFGAKLKNEGGKKVRPNDNMYSKDLQGRPIAYTNIAKDYEAYFTKKVQDDMKVEKEMKDFKVVASTYKENYASTKLDSTYNAEMQENEKKIEDAMKIGMKKYLQKKKEQNNLKSELPDNEDKNSFSKPEDSKKCEDNEEGLESVKRERPAVIDDEIPKENPDKKVKLNETLKKEAPKIMTASDKLKSLFKK